MRRFFPLFISINFFLVIFALPSYSQRKVQKPPEKTRILFLVDGSGSMLEPWGKSQTKLSVARSILTRVIDSLRQNPKIELALRLYGHQSPSQVVNCKDTELEVPFGTANHQVIIDKINRLKPSGVTPIAYSIEQSAGDFPSQDGYRNLLILITDGIESCGGDPCAVSAALQKKGVFLQPFVIGLGIPSDRSLACVGTYLNAETPGSFNIILNETLQRSFAPTSVSILLQGPSQTRHTNVNVSLLNSVTGVPVCELVNYLDVAGNPDSVKVDPLVQYDLVVSTLPPAIRKSVKIEQGRHNVITVPVSEGSLTVRQDGSGKNVMCLVRVKGERGILHTQELNQTVRYLSGEYEVETTTLPRRTFMVEIKNEKTFVLQVPQPGVVNFNTTSSGYGALYEVGDDGQQKWVTGLDNLKPVFSLTLLPGRYKIVFRVKNSQGSKFTGYKTFTVLPGKSQLVDVFR